MTTRLTAMLAIGAVCVGCSTPPPARTYTGVEVSIARMRAEWQRSQLTEHPQQTLITRDLRFHLFFQLPLPERAVVVMERFANAEFDGEVGLMMAQMLRYRTDPGFAGAIVDPAYTAELFHAIESHSKTQVRRFCSEDAETYARFRRNLHQWKVFFRLRP